MEEVGKGWLQGPLGPDEAPVDVPISRRFGLQQARGKVRLSDDFTESVVNKCSLVNVTGLALILAFWCVRLI